MTYLKKLIIDAPLVPIGYILGGLLAVCTAILFKSSSTIWTLGYGVLMIIGGLIFIHTSVRGKKIIWNNIITRLNIPTNSQILDLGTGHGLVLMQFARKLTKDGHATGIDLWHNHDQSNNTITNTQALIDANHLTNVTSLLTANMLDLPFSANKFDFVTASMAIHNIKPQKQRQMALAEAMRVLKPTGKLVIVDTAYNKHEYLNYLKTAGFIIEDQHTYGINGWWTGPWMATYSIIARKPK